MPKSAYRSTPIVVSGYLYTDDAHTGTRIDTLAWFGWLAGGRTFYYETPMGAFTARCEKRRNGVFWYAFRRYQGKLRKVYLGRSSYLTRSFLDDTVTRLALSGYHLTHAGK